MKKLLLICGLVCALAPVVQLGAYVLARDSQGRPLRWEFLNPPAFVKTNSFNRATQAIRYYVATDAYSTNNRLAEINAVRASFAQWQAIPGTRLKFEDGGLAPAGMDINIEDGTNVVYWAKTSTIVNGGLDNISGTLGVCFYSFYDQHILAEADIVLNGVQKSWTADYFASNTTAVFIESVTVHEIGHGLGFSHATAGGATMLAYGDVGQSSQAGLSSDDLAAARALYPAAAIPGSLGHLRGVVRKDGQPVLGAAVFLEDAAGNVLAGTVTRADGNYEISAVPAGAGQVRATPLDPPIDYWLVSGFELGGEYSNADLLFLPTTNHPVVLTAGDTNALDIDVLAASPPFRITQIRHPTANPNAYSISSLPVALFPGQSNLTIGVFSQDLPSSGLDLKVTGSGITHGARTPHAMNSIFPGFAGVSVVISVASNAPTGMRSLVVTRTNDGAQAYANGFVDIRPVAPDFNFDGLDDRFQRRYFPLFTAPEAAPEADPDGDTLNNAAESMAGTAPTNAVSVLKLESVTQDFSGSTLRWRSVPGKKYQVFGRPQVASGAWQALGAPVTATNSLADYFDAGATNDIKFYQVQVLP